MTDFTADIFRTMVVPASKAALAREIAVAIKPVEGQGMWTSPFSPDGQEPATHFISTGYISPEWLLIMPLQVWEEVDGVWTMTSSFPGDAALLEQALKAAGSAITQAQIVDLFGASDVTEQPPWLAIERLGLSPAQPAEPPI